MSVPDWRLYPTWQSEPDRVDLETLPAWIVQEDDAIIAVNKPPWLVCHPSKHGPTSSLVGALRAYTGLETLHLIARLDRETSGLVLLAKQRPAARRLQMALEKRAVKKHYLVLLEGELGGPETIDLPLGPDRKSPVHIKQTWGSGHGFQNALTHFVPLHATNGFTLAEVRPETGRKHQIRVHAQVLGYPVVGDKLYGPDETLYLDFIEHGWTERHAASLPLRRQGLHCHSLRFDLGEESLSFAAPLFFDLAGFCTERLPGASAVVANYL
ncbi:MAG: RluA family pseudouridine synthase [Opitutales bacterium]